MGFGQAGGRRSQARSPRSPGNAGALSAAFNDSFRQSACQILPPVSCVFVIISSDQDFRHHYQLLTSAGYRVLVIHSANTRKWSEVSLVLVVYEIDSLLSGARDAYIGDHELEAGKAREKRG